jgi:hypothetical protein
VRMTRCTLTSTPAQPAESFARSPIDRRRTAGPRRSEKNSLMAIVGRVPDRSRAGLVWAVADVEITVDAEKREPVQPAITAFKTPSLAVW